MAIKEILTEPNKLLRQISKPVETVGKAEQKLMNDMLETMYSAKGIGLVLLRLVEVIGSDEIKDIGSETLYFIISALNQLNIDPLRNKILFKVLPLKVQKYK